jgi:hypothetical protein
MKGTFKPGDKLYIEKISLEKVKRGDLIIFSTINKGGDDFVVHRVVDKSPGGLATRGDNTFYWDRESVSRENIIGRVIHYDRNGKIHKAWNGGAGMLRTGALHCRLHFIRVVKFFLRKPYHMIKKSGIVAKFWQPEIEIIHFETNSGPLIKYIHKGTTVAIYWTKKNRWWCKRPYDFVIGLKLNK